MDIVIIPGIGGHPIFHNELVESLASCCPGISVKSTAHLGFGGSPHEVAFDLQCQHWTEFIQTQCGTDNYAIIGISFGSAIAQALVNTISVPPKTCILISPPILPNGFLFLLRKVNLPIVLKKAFGGFLFKLSELGVEDPAVLREQRKHLYHDVTKVKASLWDRFKSLGQGPTADQYFDVNHKVFKVLIYGKAEILYRYTARSMARSSIDLVVIDGAHNLSIRKSPALMSAIKEKLC